MLSILNLIKNPADIYDDLIMMMMQNLDLIFNDEDLYRRVEAYLPFCLFLLIKY